MAVLKNNTIFIYTENNKKNLYYYKVDTEAKTVSFYAAETNKNYVNDTGKLIFTEKISSLRTTTSSNSSSTITNANDTLLQSFGKETLRVLSNTALNRIENSSDEDISKALGITEKGNPQQIQKVTGRVPQTSPSGLDEVTRVKNQKLAEGLKVTTANLPVIEKSLTYPQNLDTSIQDTLQINIFKYEPARRLPSIRDRETDTGTIIPGGATDDARFLRTGSDRKKKAITTIIIPIPNAVGDSNAVSWGGGQFSSVAGTLGGEINNAIFGTLQQTGTGPLDDFTKISNAVGGAVQGGLRAGAELISNPYVQRKVLLENLAKAAGVFGINVDVTQVITRTGGVVENPNLELLFTGPSLRSFQFTVRFTPRSAPESVIVRQIIRVLKQHSAVKKGVTLGISGFGNGDKKSNLLLGTPDVFTLKYIRSGSREEIKGLTKMKTCALTNLSVDYTGDAGRWAAYDGDSQPVTTLVTMNFAELAPIYDTDYISDTLANDDVGF